ncbi:MAG: Gfo/Idh/MocA family oxidoreductase [Thermoproteota archaeon]
MYRIGIIGCGGIANAHAKAYVELGLEITAASDIDQVRLKEFSKIYNIKNTYTDYREMLHRERLDIVSICTWPMLHCEMTERAAEEGVKGIICEKPMAMNLAEAERMITACEKTGAKLAIGHMRRFLKIYNEVKNLFKSGIIGEPDLIHGFSVGDLLSDGTHLIDLIRFINGDEKVNWVFGQVDVYEKRRRYGHYVEDASIGYFEFENELRAFIEISQVSLGTPKPGEVGFSQESLFRDLNRVNKIRWWKKKVPYCAIRIYGSNGMIQVDEREDPPLRYRGKNDKDWQTISISQESDPFKLQIEALIKAIEENVEHPCNGEQGRRTLEVIMAIYESARRREIVLLPLEIDENPLFEIIEGGRLK